MTPQEQLGNALIGDATLMNYVQDDDTKVVNEMPSKDMFGPESYKENFPMITYVLADRRHAFFADNVPYMDELEFAIDIWLPEDYFVEFSLNTIKKEIDRIVLALGYIKFSESEKQTINEKVAHLSLRYTKEFPTSDL
jgi:hypothetical protein